MGTTNILDLNNRIDALEKSFHELKIWTTAEAKSVSGNPITLTDGSARKAEGLVVTLEPIQSGSGTPSPTNVRPITGLTECVVDRDGKNKLNVNDVEIGTAWNGAISPARARLVIPCSPSTTYTVSINGTNSFDIIYINDGEAVPLSSSGSDLTTTKTFTTRASSNYIVIGFNKTSVAKADVEALKLQLELGSSATSYVPYSHDTATITFGQTVYGGSVDFKTGKVTVTHASIASYNGESIKEPWLSSIDEYVSGTTPTTGAQVVYPLTTPTELTLTPAELELLKGYNYITTNGTTIALDYLSGSLKADILLTVSQLYGSKISIFDEILAGGDTGQVLTKASDDNYDATWATLPTTRTANKK